MTETPEGGDFGIRSIVEDHDGFFWFCNSRYRYQISSEKNRGQESNQIDFIQKTGAIYSTDNGKKIYPYFLSMTLDDDGDLWMASYDDGVYRYSGEKLLHYPVKFDKVDVLSYSIYKDKFGFIWLGTHNAGAFKYNGKNFERFSP